MGPFSENWTCQYLPCEITVLAHVSAIFDVQVLKNHRCAREKLIRCFPRWKGKHSPKEMAAVRCAGSEVCSVMAALWTTRATKKPAEESVNWMFLKGNTSCSAISAKTGIIKPKGEPKVWNYSENGLGEAWHKLRKDLLSHLTLCSALLWNCPVAMAAKVTTCPPLPQQNERTRLVVVWIWTLLAVATVHWGNWLPLFKWCMLVDPRGIPPSD